MMKKKERNKREKENKMSDQDLYEQINEGTTRDSVEENITPKTRVIAPQTETKNSKKTRSLYKIKHCTHVLTSLDSKSKVRSLARSCSFSFSRSTTRD